MSEAVRAVALAEATKLKGDTGDAAAVLDAAKLYLDFLSGGPTTPPSRTAAGAEPAPKADAKPSANTAGAKKTAAAATKAATKAAAEDAAAKAALKAAEEQEGGDEPTGPSEAFTADKEGVSAAVAAMIANKTGEGPNRDKAIELLKKYKAASVSAMQAKDAATIGKFIAEVNEAFGLEAGEPDLEG
jgi:hypothetical protein